MEAGDLDRGYLADGTRQLSKDPDQGHTQEIPTMNPYSQVLDQIDSVKPAGPGYAPRLTDGTYELVLTRFDGKNSDQNKGIIFEADFLVEKSTDPSTIGQKRGWPFWPQSQGWAAAHEARRWGSFTSAIDQSSGRPVARVPKEVGNDLFTGMYRGIRLRAVVSPRFNKDGTRMLDKKMKPVCDIEFSVVAPQTMQEIQAKALTLAPEQARPVGGQQFQNAPHPSQMPGQYPAQNQPQYAQQPQYQQPQYAQPPAQPQYAPPQAQPQYAPPQAQPQYAPPAAQPQYAPAPAQPQYAQPPQPAPGQYAPPPAPGQYAPAPAAAPAPGAPPLGSVLAGLTR